MTAAIQPAAFGQVRPLHPERAVTFKAWRNSTPVKDEYVLRALQEATTLDEAAAILAASSCHKTILSVLMIDSGRNRKTLGHYKVAASTTSYTWRDAYDGGRRVKVPKLVAKLLVAMPVHSFAPVEPFDAFRDDPVGRDFQLVEG